MVKLKILFLLCIVAVIWGENILPRDENISTRDDDHNIFHCTNLTIPKRLVHSVSVNETKKFLRVQKKTVVFPFIGLNDKKITCLSVKNRASNVTGGYPIINSGGVGYYDVIIHFTSQRSQGLNFIVKIYADIKR